MEEDVLSLTPETKLYTERTIFLLAFFGGPLAGGYVIAENFRGIGEPRRSLFTWCITILYLVFLLTCNYLIPVMNDVPGVVYAAIYPICAGLIVRNLQGPAIKAHLESGGQFYPAWKAWVVGIIGLLITLGLIIGAMAVFVKSAA